MPPPKRNRGNDDSCAPDGSAASLLFGDCGPSATDLSAGVVADGFHDFSGLNLPMASGSTAQLLQSQHHEWRTLQMADAVHLQRGVNVKVYRADERWHHGVLENV
jgi:hypothetical protein